MAFKIKDNLDLYGNQLLNFALQSDSGFPQSPQVGHMFNYTGTGVMANHAVMCVDETTKAFKALAFVDEIATNAEFVELKEKVDLLIGDDVDTDTIIDSWKEVQAFLADIEDTKTLQGMLSSYLPLSGGTLQGGLTISQGNLIVNGSDTVVKLLYPIADNTYALGHDGRRWSNVRTVLINGGTPIHSGNIEDYALKTDGSNKMSGEKGISWSSTGATGNSDSYESSLFVGWDTVADSALSQTKRRYCSVLNVGGAHVAGYRFQLAANVGGYNELFFRTYDNNQGVWQDWKTIAFTDSVLLLDGSNKMSAGVKFNEFNIDLNVGLGDGIRLIERSAANAPSNTTWWNTFSAVGGNGGIQIASFPTHEDTILYARAMGNSANSWKSWKTIAFTDSDITGNAGSAYKLVASDKSDVVTILPDKTTVFATSQINYGGHYFKKDNSYIALFGTGEQVDATKTGAMIYAYGSRNIYLYTSGKERMTINSSGNVTIGESDLAGTSAKLLVGGNAVIGGAITVDKKDTLLSLYSLTEAGIMLQSDGSGGDVAAIYEHKGAGNGLTFAESSRDFIWRTGTDAYKGGGAGTERMRLTNGGNVLIGTTDDNGGKLQVKGGISTFREIEKNDWDAFTIHHSGSWATAKNFVAGIHVTDGTSTVGRFGITYGDNGGAFIVKDLYGGSGGVRLEVSALKTVIKGDLYVNGNIIATKEVSAGGAGQEGESGDGGAEVIDAPIPSGVTTYTISNTIGRSAVAVSLYEANVINGQTIWSLCLADIEVTDSQITVTFGSATSVNHKLVAVG